MTRRIEYQAVWPNGEPAHEIIQTDREQFFKRFDDLILKLNEQGIPKEYRPVVKARVVEIVEHAWGNWDDVERDFKNAELTEPRHRGPGTQELFQTQPNLKNPWPTPDQITRVKSRRFSFEDPCVICGTRFSMCPHTNFETEAFVTMVKNMDKR